MALHSREAEKSLYNRMSVYSSSLDYHDVDKIAIKLFYACKWIFISHLWENTANHYFRFNLIYIVWGITSFLWNSNLTVLLSFIILLLIKYYHWLIVLKLSRRECTGCECNFVVPKLLYSFFMLTGPFTLDQVVSCDMSNFSSHRQSRWI